MYICKILKLFCKLKFFYKRLCSIYLSLSMTKVVWYILKIVCWRYLITCWIYKWKYLQNNLLIKHNKLNLFAPSNCIIFNLIRSYKNYIISIFYKVFFYEKYTNEFRKFNNSFYRTFICICVEWLGDNLLCLLLVYTYICK